MNAIAFAHSNAVPNEYETGYMAGLEDVFDKLSAAGVEPVVTAYAEQAFHEDGVIVYTPNAGIYPRTRRLEDIGAVVGIVHRLLNYDELPSSELMPPLVNENAVRSLGFRKATMYDDVLAPQGLGIPTLLIGPDTGCEDFLTEHSSSHFIVKNNSLSNKNGIQKLERAAVYGHFASGVSSKKPQVLQPAYDFGTAMPATMRPYDTASSDKFTALRASADPKELRMYAFTDPVKTTCFPVARTLKNGDNWFFVDPDSLPQKLTEQTQTTIEKIATLTGSAAIYGAVDFGYGTSDDRDPDWNIIEVNVRAPHMIKKQEHAGVANELRELFVGQLLLTAQHRWDMI